MQRIIKRIPLHHGRLAEIAAGRRLLLATFTGEVVIIEERQDVAVLGTYCKGEKRLLASVMLCREAAFQSDRSIHAGKVYEATGDVQRGDGMWEEVFFAGLRFEDSDPVAGTLTFEIPDLELIERLIAL